MALILFFKVALVTCVSDQIALSVVLGSGEQNPFLLGSVWFRGAAPLNPGSAPALVRGSRHPQPTGGEE